MVVIFQTLETKFLVVNFAMQVKCGIITEFSHAALPASLIFS
jgi:hypothetical protein